MLINEMYVETATAMREPLAKVGIFILKVLMTTCDFIPGNCCNLLIFIILMTAIAQCP